MAMKMKIEIEQKCLAIRVTKLCFHIVIFISLFFNGGSTRVRTRSDYWAISFFKIIGGHSPRTLYLKQSFALFEHNLYVDLLRVFVVNIRGENSRWKKHKIECTINGSEKLHCTFLKLNCEKCPFFDNIIMDFTTEGNLTKINKIECLFQNHPT